jgi:low affinity Fe/Cu permease
VTKSAIRPILPEKPTGPECRLRKVHTSRNHEIKSTKRASGTTPSRDNLASSSRSGESGIQSSFGEAREQVARTKTVNLWFSRFAGKTAQVFGHPYIFLLAVLVVVVWAATGPLFGYSNTWQLVINTGTTIVTFLVVFLIQNTQNRDARAIHLKLDELIRSHVPAHNDMIDIETLSDEELEELEKRYAAICEKQRLLRPKSDA